MKSGKDSIFPVIEHKITSFMSDQEGSIPRSKILMIGSMMILMGVVFAQNIFAAHSSHKSHSSHRSHSSHSSGTTSHSSHSSHSSSTHSSSSVTSTTVKNTSTTTSSSSSQQTVVNIDSIKKQIDLKMPSVSNTSSELNIDSINSKAFIQDAGKTAMIKE